MNNSNTAQDLQQDYSAHSSYTQAILFAASYSVLYYPLMVLGSLWILRAALSLIHFVIVTILLRPLDLAKRYGAGTWAVVTGASDGIGKGFCFELAKRGFNVVLIARNKAKLEGVVAEINQVHPNVKTRVVVAEFENSPEPGFFDKIVDQIKDLDVSLLVNNVGYDILNFFFKAELKEHRDEIVVNCIPMVMLTKKLVPLMRQRSLRSGIVNVSSIAGVIPVPYLPVYCGTKAFNDYFSRAISYELHDKFDILSLRPLNVTSQGNKTTGLTALTPKQCASGCLNDLGLRSDTFGHWNHKIQGILVSMLPQKLLMVALCSLMKKKIFLNHVEQMKKKRMVDELKTNLGVE